MPSNDVQLQRAFDGAAYRSYQRSRIPARLGNGDGSTLYVFDDNNNQIFGKVWARLDGENAPRAVDIGNSMVAYDLQVIIFVDSQGNYKIEGKQVAAGNAYIQNDPSGFPFVGDVAPHGITHGRLATDPIIVESLQFFPLAVRPTQNPSLSVRVEKGWYYVDGEEYPWAGGIIDLTDYVPSSADEQVPVIVAINSVTNELAVYEGTTITSTSIGVPFTPSDVAGITVEDAVIRLAAVCLKNGMTSIGLIDIFEDLRPFYLAGSSGSGGGFANTALSNLNTPTAINQHLLSAADGTIDFGSASNTWRRVYTQAINFQDADTITIASGVATLTAPIKTRNVIAAEGAGTTDDLDTITALTSGDVIILRADTGDTITLKHNTGNLWIGRDIAMTENHRVMLTYNSTSSKWHMVGLTSDLISLAASQITAGTFGAGNYTIAGDLTVDQIGLWGTAVTADRGLALDKTLATSAYTIGLQSYLTKSNANADTVSGVEGYVTLSATSGTQSGSLFGVYGGVNISNNATPTALYGFFSETSHNGAGTITDAYGEYSSVTNLSSGTITNAYGVYATTYASGTSTITNGYGIYVDVLKSGSGTLTNGYGVYVGSLAGVANPTAILTTDGNVVFNESGNSASNVRMEGDTDQNLFYLKASSDEVVIGSSTALTAKLGIYAATASKAGIILKSTDNSTTNPLLRGQDSSGVNRWHIHYDGSVQLGRVSGGTANGNIRFTMSDQFPSMQFYSGNSYVNEIISDVTNSVFLLDAAFLDWRTAAGTRVGRMITSTKRFIIGSSNTTASATIHAYTDDAATNTVADTIYASHISSGTPAANFGVAIGLLAQSSTTTNQFQSRIRSYWTTATHASRTARSVWSAYDTAERDCIAIEASGSAAMIGLYGVNPVARPSAITQTYSTTSRTLAAYTADNESGAYSGIDNAQAGSVYAQLADLNALRVAYENLRAFTENGFQVMNAVIDDAQAIGWEQ